MQTIEKAEPIKGYPYRELTLSCGHKKDMTTVSYNKYFKNRPEAKTVCVKCR